MGGGRRAESGKLRGWRRPGRAREVPEKFFSRAGKLTEYAIGGIRLSIAMKTLLVTISLAVAGVSSAQAQIFRPSAVGNGAVVGAVAGGLIGGHNGDRWAEGAVIGGVAGALIGAAVSQPAPRYEQPPVYQQSTPQVVYTQPAPVVQSAPVAPAAPMVGAPAVIETQQPQVVYVQQAPQVVYVQPRVVYVERPPVVTFGVGFYSGPRYYGPSYRGGYHHRGHHHGRW